MLRGDGRPTYSLSRRSSVRQKRRIAHGVVERGVELVERRDQRFGHVPSAERAESVRGFCRHANGAATPDRRGVEFTHQPRIFDPGRALDARRDIDDIGRKRTHRTGDVSRLESAREHYRSSCPCPAPDPPPAHSTAARSPVPPRRRSLRTWRSLRESSTIASAVVNSFQTRAGCASRRFGLLPRLRR